MPSRRLTFVVLVGVLTLVASACTSSGGEIEGLEATVDARVATALAARPAAELPPTVTPQPTATPQATATPQPPCHAAADCDPAAHGDPPADRRG